MEVEGDLDGVSNVNNWVAITLHVTKYVRYVWWFKMDKKKVKNWELIQGDLPVSELQLWIIRFQNPLYWMAASYTGVGVRITPLHIVKIVKLPGVYSSVVNWKSIFVAMHYSLEVKGCRNLYIITYDDHMVSGLIAATLTGHITNVQSTVCRSEVVHCQWICPHTIVATGVVHEYVCRCCVHKFYETPLGDSNSRVGSVDALQSYVGADFLL